MLFNFLILGKENEYDEVEFEIDEEKYNAIDDEPCTQRRDEDVITNEPAKSSKLGLGLGSIITMTVLTCTYLLSLQLDKMKRQAKIVQTGANHLSMSTLRIGSTIRPNLKPKLILKMINGN